MTLDDIVWKGLQVLVWLGQIHKCVQIRFSTPNQKRFKYTMIRGKIQSIKFRGDNARARAGQIAKLNPISLHLPFA
jgi:hypothetical protein